MSGYIAYNECLERLVLGEWEFHCGDTLQIYINDEWVNTRVEYNHNRECWYLVGLRYDPVGLKARIL